MSSALLTRSSSSSVSQVATMVACAAHSAQHAELPQEPRPRGQTELHPTLCWPAASPQSRPCPPRPAKHCQLQPRVVSGQRLGKARAHTSGPAPPSLPPSLPPSPCPPTCARSSRPSVPSRAVRKASTASPSPASISRRASSSNDGEVHVSCGGGAGRTWVCDREVQTHTAAPHAGRRMHGGRRPSPTLPDAQPARRAHRAAGPCARRQAHLAKKGTRAHIVPLLEQRLSLRLPGQPHVFEQSGHRPRQRPATPGALPATGVRALHMPATQRGPARGCRLGWAAQEAARGAPHLRQLYRVALRGGARVQQRGAEVALAQEHAPHVALLARRVHLERVIACSGVSCTAGGCTAEAQQAGQSGRASSRVECIERTEVSRL